jgi:membrane associated rhomboid family serine protease
VLKNYDINFYINELVNNGIDVKKLTYNYHFTFSKPLFDLTNKYYESLSCGMGASGAVFAFIGSFMCLNFKSIKKIKVILLYILCFYLLYVNIKVFFPYDYIRTGSSIGHIGGLVSGVIFSIYLTTKKGN